MKKIGILLMGGFFLVACALAQEPVFSGPGVMFFQRGVAEPISKPGFSSYNYVYTTNIGEKEQVKGAPYSATAITESTQVLADGNRIVNKSSSFLARDGEGRTRRELAMGISSLPGGLPKLVVISDPVNKTEIMLNEGKQTASVMKGEHGERVFIEQSGKPGVQLKMGTDTSTLEGEHRRVEIIHQPLMEYHAATDSNPPDTAAKLKMKAKAEQLMAEAQGMSGEVKHEDLGTQVMEGVSCTGTRETRTIAAGAIGNERPIEITSETWRSPDLHTIVLSKHSDPRFGETVYKLTDIKRNEPDAALFQVPSGYKIIDREGPPLKP